MTHAFTRRTAMTALIGSLFAPRLASASMEINGGGSSFVNPVMQNWIEKLPGSVGVTPKYAVLGAGAAQSRIMAGEMDFAAMELPMPTDMLETAGLVQFPIVFGALVFVVNVEGLKSDQLTLDGKLLGGIYSGQIRNWNDPRIAAVNPGVKLPDQDIRPFHLGDPAGSVFSTTVTIQQYLLAANEDWRARHGTKITRRWAVGSMTPTAAQMIDAMKTVPGSVGYVTLGAAMGGGMTTVRLRNAAGKSMIPSLNALRAAVDRIDWAKANDLVPNLIDLPGNESWPIVLATYALIQRAPKDRLRAGAVRAFLSHVMTDGGKAAEERYAVALPAIARDAALKRLTQYTG